MKVPRVALRRAPAQVNIIREPEGTGSLPHFAKDGPVFTIDLPCTNADLINGRILSMRHDLLDLTSGLEPGQLVYGHTDDGDYWGMEVLQVRFDLAHTLYRFRIGTQVDRAMIPIMAPVRLSRGQHGTGDVRAALRLLGYLDASRRPVGRRPASGPSGHNALATTAAVRT